MVRLETEPREVSAEKGDASGVSPPLCMSRREHAPPLAGSRRTDEATLLSAARTDILTRGPPTPPRRPIRPGETSLARRLDAPRRPCPCPLPPVPLEVGARPSTGPARRADTPSRVR